MQQRQRSALMLTCLNYVYSYACSTRWWKMEVRSDSVEGGRLWRPRWEPPETRGRTRLLFSMPPVLHQSASGGSCERVPLALRFLFFAYFMFPLRGVHAFCLFFVFKAVSINYTVSCLVFFFQFRSVFSRSSYVLTLMLSCCVGFWFMFKFSRCVLFDSVFLQSVDLEFFQCVCICIGSSTSKAIVLKLGPDSSICKTYYWWCF